MQFNGTTEFSGLEAEVKYRWVPPHIAVEGKDTAIKQANAAVEIVHKEKKIRLRRHHTRLNIRLLHWERWEHT
jgi:hypothetical protein